MVSICIDIEIIERGVSILLIAGFQLLPCLVAPCETTLAAVEMLMNVFLQARNLSNSLYKFAAKVMYA